MNAGAWVFIASSIMLPLLLAEFGDWCPCGVPEHGHRC
jgi:hypothetical protein